MTPAEKRASDESLEEILDAIREEVNRARGRKRRLEVHAIFVILADGRIGAESEVCPARRRPLQERAG